MKVFKKHLNEKLQDKEFKEIFDEERELLEIAYQLLDARKRIGLTQQELAKKAHVTQQQLSKIESGLNCNIATLLRVCHALKVKLNLSFNDTLSLSPSH